MRLYKSKDCDVVFIRLEKKHKQYAFMSVSEKIDLSRQNFRCVYSYNASDLEEIEEYEIIFNKEIKKKLIENEKYVPYDIEKNCKKCTVSCFYNTKLLNNKILEEYHNFIKNLKENLYE